MFDREGYSLELNWPRRRQIQIGIRDRLGLAQIVTIPLKAEFPFTVQHAVLRSSITKVRTCDTSAAVKAAVLLVKCIVLSLLSIRLNGDDCAQS